MPGQTVAEKILSRHAGKQVAADDLTVIDVDAALMSDTKLPLDGIRVLDFTHNVMGPTTGMLMGDLGAEVIHIEPPAGDATRRLRGFGSGYFAFYSRNKKSLAVNLKADEGKKIVMDLVSSADVVVENFGPGTMDRLGYGYEAIKEIRSDIIYCSMKGFLSGPYEKRAASSAQEYDMSMPRLIPLTGFRGYPEEEMLARALISDIMVYNRDLYDKAKADGNLLEALGPEIKKSWELYKDKVTAEVANSTNHFRDALNEILADAGKLITSGEYASDSATGQGDLDCEKVVAELKAAAAKAK